MNIWGTNGKKLGEVRQDGNTTKVYDQHGQPSGSVKPTGTFDKGGRKISDYQDAGLILDK